MLDQELITKQFNDNYLRQRSYNDHVSIANAVIFLAWSVFQAARILAWARPQTLAGRAEG